MSDEDQNRESLSDLILALPDGGWSPELHQLLGRISRAEVRAMRIQSPRHVGVEGDRWDEPTESELTTSCYAWCILGQRLDQFGGTPSPGKLDALRVKARLEGLGVGYLRNAVRNHIRDLQRRQRPQAWATFKRIREAIVQLEKQGKLRITPSPPPDKHSVVSFCHVVGDVVASPTLAELVRSCPGLEQLRERLLLLGEQPTKEIWMLFDHLAAAGCAGFKVGELLEVLDGLVGGPAEHFVEDAGLITRACGDSPVDGEQVALRLDALLGRIRAAVSAADCSAAMRERLLSLLAARLELLEHPDTPELSLTALGATCGLDRRRASEAWNLLVEIIEQELGRNVADTICDRVSDS